MKCECQSDGNKSTNIKQTTIFKLPQRLSFHPSHEHFFFRNKILLLEIPSVNTAKRALSAASPTYNYWFGPLHDTESHLPDATVHLTTSYGLIREPQKGENQRVKKNVNHKTESQRGYALPFFVSYN